LKTLYGVLHEDNNKNNKLEILEYANDKNLGSVTFIPFHDFYKMIIDNKLAYNSSLILQNMTYLGDTLIAILENINTLISSNITLHIIESNLEISALTCKPLVFTQSLLDCEEKIHQKRLEERRAKNIKNGIKVGRKQGVLVRSKFDPHREKIEELYQLGLSMKKISEHLKVGTQQSLYHYIKSRGIKNHV
jgi:hypothetical protein